MSWWWAGSPLGAGPRLLAAPKEVPDLGELPPGRQILLARDISLPKLATRPGPFKERSVLALWGEEEDAFLNVLCDRERTGPGRGVCGSPLLLLSLTGIADSF